MSKYLFELGLENLSGRIHIVTDKNDTFRNYINRPTKKDNLEHNITWIITRLLVAIDISNTRTVSRLMDAINDHNEKNNSSINLDLFKEKKWIRVILDSIEFPAQVSRYFRLLEKGDAYSLPPEEQTLLKFLYDFKKTSETNIRVIAKDKVQKVLSKTELQLLIDRGILKPGKKQFTITNNEYFNYLKNELTAAIWLELSKTEENNSEKIKRFVNIIIRFGIYWPDRLSDYFEDHELNAIQILAYQILIKEEDLLNNGHEFIKTWLDAPLDSNISLDKEPPAFEIIGETTHQLYKHILELKKRNYWLYQETDTVRLKYGLLLTLIFQTVRINKHGSNNCQVIFNLLNDVKRPYLIYHSCEIIEIYYQHLTPYFLTDINTSALSFNLLREIKFKENVTHKDFNDTYLNRKENELKTQFFKSQFDLFLDKISLNQITDKNVSVQLYNVLLDQAINFYNNTTFSNQVVHQEERKRFEYFIKVFSEKRVTGHFNGIIRPRIFPKFLSSIIENLIEEQEKNNQYLGFNCPKFELIFQIANLSNVNILENELTPEEGTELTAKCVALVENWNKLFLDYFVIDFIDVLNPENKKYEKQRITRLTIPRSIEILNWGYFWAYINEYGLLRNLLAQLRDSLILDNTDLSHVSDTNAETNTKLKFLVKSLALGINEIERNKPKFTYSFQGIESLLNELQIFLQELTIRHCVTDLQNQRLNIFDQKLSFSNNDLYHVPAIKLVFNALNKNEKQSCLNFHKALLSNDLNLLFLLTVINLSESQEIVDLLTERINQIDVEEYIKSVSNVDQWKNAIVEALHSSNHFEIAIPIISKIEAWMEKVKIGRDQYSNLIFRTKLMLAFKQKKVEDIINLKAPAQHHVSLSPNPLEEQKKYYLALHWGYNENNFLKADEIFQQLISDNPRDTNSHYNIFHLGTLYHIAEGNTQELIRLKNNWEQFAQSAEELGVKDDLKIIQPNINYTLLYHHCHFKDYDGIDRIIQNLDPILKYDRPIIEYIFQSYLDRELPINAHSYLTSIEEYNQGKDSQIIELVQLLRERIDSADLIVKLKAAYSQIYGMSYKDLPKLVPSKINGKSNIQEFILKELLSASLILIEKINSVNEIRFENKYNDLLLAILRLRFAVWGWEISDQARAGSSNSNGSDLGELDIVIREGGSSICLIEALVLTTSNKSYTETHIKKCFNYLPSAKYHYIVVYYKGSDSTFVSSWETYKKNVLEIIYEEKQKILSGFVDTSAETEVNNICTGVTHHANGVNLYHIYINIPSK